LATSFASDSRRRTINTDNTPKFDEFPTTSPGKRKNANGFFWLLCVVTSTSSVAILLVLLLSICYKGIPAFSPPTDDIKSSISDIGSQIADLKQVSPVDQDAIDNLEEEKKTLNETLDVISKSLLNKPPAPEARESGIGPALMGSIWVCIGCAAFFLPLGVGTAIFLEEFKPRNKILRWLSGLIQLNISNLAGVPSIVYGILGMTAFATMFGVFGSTADPYLELGTTFRRQYLTEGMQVVFVPVEGRESIPELSNGMTAFRGDGTEVKLNIIGDDDDFPEDDKTLNVSLFSDAEGGVVADSAWYSFRLPFGRSVLAASLTLMLVILPVVIISTQEALRAVPSSLRQGAQGLGCTPWQTVRNVTLPAAIPGIMTGCILSMSRAIGEAAPILMISGIIAISTGPGHLMDDFSILPLQIYYWAGLPPGGDFDFRNVAAGGIIVLLIVLFAFNSVAILFRLIAQKRLS